MITFSVSFLGIAKALALLLLVATGDDDTSQRQEINATQPSLAAVNNPSGCDGWQQHCETGQWLPGSVTTSIGIPPTPILNAQGTDLRKVRLLYLKLERDGSH